MIAHLEEAIVTWIAHLEEEAIMIAHLEEAIVT